MNFRQFIENQLPDDQIDWWSSYARSHNFPSETAAREFIFNKLQRNDKEFGTVFGVNGPQKNQTIAQSMSLYRSGKSFKIGKRIRSKPLNWQDIDVRPNSLAELTTAGYLNPFDNPRLSPIQLMSLHKIRKTENHTETEHGQEYVMQFANKIKNGNAYFKAILIDDHGAIIDGHHRYEVAKLLKFKRIPVQITTTE